MGPRGVFTSRAHPEERSDEGSLEILPRFARQDFGVWETPPTPHLLRLFFLEFRLNRLLGGLYGPEHVGTHCDYSSRNDRRDHGIF